MLLQETEEISPLHMRLQIPTRVETKERDSAQIVGKTRSLFRQLLSHRFGHKITSRQQTGFPGLKRTQGVQNHSQYKNTDKLPTDMRTEMNKYQPLGSQDIIRSKQESIGDEI